MATPITMSIPVTMVLERESWETASVEHLYQVQKPEPNTHRVEDYIIVGDTRSKRGNAALPWVLPW